MLVGKLKDAPLEPVKSRSTAEIFTRYKSLSELAGIGSVSVMFETLAPGHRASSPHVHSARDEFYIVLKGSPTVHSGRETATLAPGDYVAFPAGRGDFHYLHNPTDTEVELITIASCPDNDVIEYAPAGSEARTDAE